jgi:hypothetical protein
MGLEVNQTNHYRRLLQVMEAFVSKFNRFQDMMGDKLLPALLTWKGERSGAFIDT